MPIKSDREYRDMSIEIRKAEDASDEKVVEGYFTTFDSPYLLYSRNGNEIWETVDPSAFDETDMTDVIMQYDHQGRVFARKSNGTLEIDKDDHGMKMSADLGGTTIGQELYEEIRGGYTSKMSFGFTVTEEEYRTEWFDNDHWKDTRIIKKVGKLYDVSAVSLPANDQTEISARSLFDGVSEKRMSERAKVLDDRAKELRLKMMLRIKTMEE